MRAETAATVRDGEANHRGDRAVGLAAHSYGVGRWRGLPVGTLSARSTGVLAVIGLVIAFSLSSTLVKRAETPGVLVAFWRLAVVSVVWNLYLWSTGRRVTWRQLRQAFVPGVFFGLNLAAFFSGATHNE